MTRSFVLTLIILFSGSGCVTALRPITGLKCEAEGHTGWTLHEAPHATVLTDLDDPVARELVAAVEGAYRTLEATGFVALPAMPLSVVATTFKSWTEVPTWNVPDTVKEFPVAFPVFTDEGTTLLLQLRADIPSANVAMPRGLTVRERTAIVHAATRTLARAAIPAIPTWLEDGLASYLEDVHVVDGQARVGVPGRDVLDRSRRSVDVPLDELTTVTPCGELEHQPWHAARWRSFLLFHHLATHRGADLRGYTSRLGAGEDAGAAWRAAFPDLAPDRSGALGVLEKDLRRLGSRKEFTEARYALASGPAEVKRTPLACTDARVARIAAFTELGLRNRLDHEARQLLAEIPGQPDALVARAELAAAPERPALLRAALQRAPASARGWALLAEDLPAGPERAEAATRASALGGAEPGIEVRVAEARLDQGATGEAVQIARQVLAAQPWSVRGNLVLARGLAGQGRCREARTALARAEGRFADQCPDQPYRNPAWRLEQERLYPLPGAALHAARREVGACIGELSQRGSAAGP